jgi:hypothetical protein
MNKHVLLLAILALLLVSCSSKVGQEVHGTITTENVGFLLAPSEVDEHGRDGLSVYGDVVSFMDRAQESGADIKNIEEWVGIDFAESVDGARFNFSLLDMVDPESANARFSSLSEEFLLVESDQQIGERFAGLAPKIGNLDTVVIFLVRDKVALMTTTTSFTEYSPLMTSEQLVEIARLIAPRIIP